jgi:hypothetical protein
LEAYASGDVDEMLAHIDAEGELHSAIIGGAEGKVYRGHDGFRDGSPTCLRASTRSGPS